MQIAKSVAVSNNLNLLTSHLNRLTSRPRRLRPHLSQRTVLNLNLSQPTGIIYAEALCEHANSYLQAASTRSIISAPTCLPTATATATGLQTTISNKALSKFSTDWRVHLRFAASSQSA